MARRIPSAAVAAAFLLGTWSADAFQPHARVSVMKPSRVQQNGSTVDMVSVFGRDVQVRLFLSRWDSKAPESVGRVRGFRYKFYGMAENTDAVEKAKVDAASRHGRVGRSAALGLLVCDVLFGIMRHF